MKKRTDTQIIDALEALPCRVDIIYKMGEPRSDSAPPLRDQINLFLDEELKHHRKSSCTATKPN